MEVGMNLRWIAVAVLLAGCVSLSSKIATRAPEGRSAADVAKDQADCEAYGGSKPKNRGDHYQACMMARSYAANVDMDEIGWVVGVVQTRPHDAETIFADMAECDRRADKAKASDNLPRLSFEREGAPQAGAGSTTTELYRGLFQQRPNATRMLAQCFEERGYQIAPWIQEIGRR
jgi:hypothetical protein